MGIGYGCLLRGKKKFPARGIHFAIGVDIACGTV